MGCLSFAGALLPSRLTYLLGTIAQVGPEYANTFVGIWILDLAEIEIERMQWEIYFGRKTRISPTVWMS